MVPLVYLLVIRHVCPVFRDAHPAGTDAAGRDCSAHAGSSRDAGAWRDARAAPVVPVTRGDARWRPAPAYLDGACASCVAGASKTLFVCTARRPRGSHAASCAWCAGRPSDWFSCGRTRPTTICQAQFFSATMPRGTSHGAARLLELELDQAGERRTRHASRAHTPRTPIALALFMPPASVGVCRERRRLRWSRCASRARATRRSCSASA